MTMLYHYSERRILFTVMLNVIMLSVVMLSVVARFQQSQSNFYFDGKNAKKFE